MKDENDNCYKLKIENNVLYTENDVKFTDWLLEFFGTKNKN